MARKTTQQLKAEIRDLYHRQDWRDKSAENRKVRKELGRAIHQKEQELSQKIDDCDNCVSFCTGCQLY